LYFFVVAGMEGLGQEPGKEVSRFGYESGVHQRGELEPHQQLPPGGAGPPGHLLPFLMGATAPPHGGDPPMKKSASADSLPVFCAAPIDEVSQQKSQPQVLHIFCELHQSCGSNLKRGLSCIWGRGGAWRLLATHDR